MHSVVTVETASHASVAYDAIPDDAICGESLITSLRPISQRPVLTE